MHVDLSEIAPDELIIFTFKDEEIPLTGEMALKRLLGLLEGPMCFGCLAGSYRHMTARGNDALAVFVAAENAPEAKKDARVMQQKKTDLACSILPSGGRDGRATS